MPPAIPYANLSPLLFVLLAVFVVAVLAIIARNALSPARSRRSIRRFQATSDAIGGSYFLKPSIITAGERAFLPVLQAVAQPYQVMCSVRLADIFGVVQGARWQQLFNQICSKHVDFVICESETLQPLVLVELDDKTHALTHRAERDRFVDAVAATAGIPILHFRAARAYDPVVVRERVHAALAAGALQKRSQPV